jgi:hypothetical protein
MPFVPLKKSHAGVFWHGWRELLSAPHGPDKRTFNNRLASRLVIVEEGSVFLFFLGLSRRDYPFRFFSSSSVPAGTTTFSLFGIGTGVPNSKM